MKSLQLPQMSTVKPSGSTKHSDNGDCTDYLNRKFSLKAPDLVWVSDITFLKDLLINVKGKKKKWQIAKKWTHLNRLLLVKFFVPVVVEKNTG